MGGWSVFNLGKAFHDETTGKVILVALLLLFFVVAFVISLHLYTKWYLLRSPPPSPAATATTVLRRRAASAMRRGLDLRVLKAIPVLVFVPNDSKNLVSNEKRMECAVCLSEVAEGERYRVLPKCQHGFHVDCIDMWFASHMTCPLCRDPVSVPGLSFIKKEHSEVNLDAILETVRAENAAMFPTNVLFWGNHAQVSTRTFTTVEDTTSTTVATGATSSFSSGTVTIDMPRQAGVEDEEQPATVTTRLRSLKRLLSRDRKVIPIHDVTQL